MRAIDLKHLGRDRAICCWEVDGVLVDPGPQTCMDTLVDELDGQAPRALLLTHIHLDHAGATGSLVERWPELPVYVHEIGAPHMVSPERLITSATRLYGEEGMQTLWGEILPVPAQNVKALVGGETILDGFRVVYTPGHASHHVTYLHEDSGCAFVGDVAGVQIPPAQYVLAPTPPPDVDIVLWEQSLDKVLALNPSQLALTHFGSVTDPQQHLESVRTALRHVVELAGANDLEGFVDALRTEITAQAGEVAPQYWQAAPLEHLWLGLDRWRTKNPNPVADRLS